MESRATASSSAPVSETSKPINLLPNQISYVYAHLHPVLLLSTLYFSFNALVTDPVNTLTNLAIVLAIAQGLYCILCLPPSGTQAASQTNSKPGQKRKPQPTSPIQHVLAKITPTILSLLMTLVLSTPTLYLTTLLFGAPLTTQHAATFLFALHLALLATPQLYYVHGLDAPTWLRIASLQEPVDEVYGMSLGACVGAWVGAVPIPLDWDREWQRWPVTVVVGLWIGAVAGKLLGAWAWKGLRITLA